jgi:hypothetical protein
VPSVYNRNAHFLPKLAKKASKSSSAPCDAVEVAGAVATGAAVDCRNRSKSSSFLSAKARETGMEVAGAGTDADALP